MSDRPKPPPSGACGSVLVSDCWYEYLNADRDWALAELWRYREALGLAYPIVARTGAVTVDGFRRREIAELMHGLLAEPKEAP